MKKTLQTFAFSLKRCSASPERLRHAHLTALLHLTPSLSVPEIRNTVTMEGGITYIWDHWFFYRFSSMLTDSGCSVWLCQVKTPVLLLLLSPLESPGSVRVGRGAWRGHVHK